MPGGPVAPWGDGDDFHASPTSRRHGARATDAAAGARDGDVGGAGDHRAGAPGDSPAVAARAARGVQPLIGRASSGTPPPRKADDSQLAAALALLRDSPDGEDSADSAREAEREAALHAAMGNSHFAKPQPVPRSPLIGTGVPADAGTPATTGSAKKKKRRRRRRDPLGFHARQVPSNTREARVTAKPTAVSTHQVATLQTAKAVLEFGGSELGDGGAVGGGGGGGGDAGNFSLPLLQRSGFTTRHAGAAAGGGFGAAAIVHDAAKLGLALHTPGHGHGLVVAHGRVTAVQAKVGFGSALADSRKAPDVAGAVPVAGGARVSRSRASSVASNDSGRRKLAHSNSDPARRRRASRDGGGQAARSGAVGANGSTHAGAGESVPQRSQRPMASETRIGRGRMAKQGKLRPPMPQGYARAQGAGASTGGTSVDTGAGAGTGAGRTHRSTTDDAAADERERRRSVAEELKGQLQTQTVTAKSPPPPPNRHPDVVRSWHKQPGQAKKSKVREPPGRDDKVFKPKLSKKKVTKTNLSPRTEERLLGRKWREEHVDGARGTHGATATPPPVHHDLVDGGLLGPTGAPGHDIVDSIGGIRMWWHTPTLVVRDTHAVYQMPGSMASLKAEKDKAAGSSVTKFPAIGGYARLQARAMEEVEAEYASSPTERAHDGGPRGRDGRRRSLARANEIAKRDFEHTTVRDG